MQESQKDELNTQLFRGMYGENTCITGYDVSGAIGLIPEEKLNKFAKVISVWNPSTNEDIEEVNIINFNPSNMDSAIKALNECTLSLNNDRIISDESFENNQLDLDKSLKELSKVFEVSSK